MNKLSILILIIVLILGACVEINTQVENDQTEANALLPDKLFVNYYTTLNSDSIHDYNISNFQDTGLNLVEYIFDKALKSQIQMYEVSDLPSYKVSDGLDELTANDILHKLGMVEQTVSYTNAEGKSVTETHKSEFIADEIIEIGFIEDWFIDENEFNLSKTVHSFSFVREYIKDNPENKRKVILFSVYPKVDSLNKPHWEYLCTKATETYVSASKHSEMSELTDRENENRNAGNSIFNDRNPFWNHYAYNQLVSNLFQSVKDGELKIVDFQSKDSMNYTDVEAMMGVVEKTISFQDEDGNMVMQTIKYDLNPEDIKSLVFIEDWYLDTNSLTMKKVIKGIAPVRYFNTGNGDEIRKLIVFLAEFE